MDTIKEETKGETNFGNQLPINEPLSTNDKFRTQRKNNVSLNKVSTFSYEYENQNYKNNDILDFNRQDPINTVINYPIETNVIDSVTQISPYHGSYVNTTSPKFIWDPVLDASGYLLQIYESGVGIVVNITTTETNHTITQTLNNNKIHTWAVWAIDTNGELGWGGSSWQFTVDTTPPSIIYTAYNTYRNDHTPTIDWYPNFDSELGGYDNLISSEFILANDSGILTSFNTTLLSYTTDYLDDGVYQLSIRGTDFAGNLGMWANNQLVVDTTPPTTPALSYPKPGSRVPYQPVTIVWTDSIEENLLQYRIWYSQYSDFREYGLATSTSTDKTLNLASGIWYIRLLADDKANLDSGWSTTYSFRIDLSEPVIPLLGIPSDHLHTASTPNFTWQPISVAVSYEFQLSVDVGFNSIIYTNYTTSTNLQLPISLSEGTHYWRVRVIDYLGVIKDWSQVNTFYMDTTPPDGNEISSPQDLLITNNPTPFLSWSAIENISSYQLEISNMNNFSELNVNTSTANAYYTLLISLSDGIYYFRIKPVDLAGNIGTYSLVFSFTVDTINNQTPTISWPQENAIFSVSNIYVNWTGSEYDYQIQLSLDPSYSLLVINTSTPLEYLELINLPNAEYFIRIRSFDLAGNPSPWSTTITFEIDIVSPTISNPSDLQYFESEINNVVGWTVGDEHPYNYTILINNTFWKSNTWVNGTISQNLDGFSVGYYEITIIISDIVGNSAENTIILWVRDSTPPEINHPNDEILEVGFAEYYLYWTISDYSPSTYNVTKNGELYSEIPEWQNGTISVRIDPLGLGIFIFEISVYDAEGNFAKDIIIISVVDTGAPEINNPPDFSYELGSIGNVILWEVSDNSPNTYNVTVNGVEFIPNTIWSNGTITVNIDGLQLGDNQVILSVIDTEGNFASNLIIVKVIDTTDPIIETEINNLFYEAGTLQNFISWNITDLMADEYYIELNGSLHIQSFVEDGTLTFNIDNLEVGSYNFTLIVFDVSENWATSTVIVSVIDTTKPTISGINEITYELGSKGNSLSWEINDLFPGDYSVIYSNGSFYELGQWLNGILTINFDGFHIGVFTLTLLIEDFYGNFDQNNIQITVLDTIIPEISSPLDVEYSQGSTGNMITWIVGDRDPGIYTISIDGVLFSEESLWTNGSISVDIDGLVEGLYSIEINVYDQSGNQNRDIVIIKVNPTRASESSSPPPTSKEADTVMIFDIVILSVLVPIAMIYVRKIKRDFN